MSDVIHAPPPEPACRLLAFDTSIERMSLALVTPHTVLALDLPGGAQASLQLLPQLQALLGRAGCSFADLDAIAYGSGPGAFTGLRTACSVAQGLAFGAGLPVVPVDSLMLVAESARDAMLAADADTVRVAQDARMDEIYGAVYRWQAGMSGGTACWQVLSEPALYSVDAFNAAWSTEHFSAAARPLLVGSALGVFDQRLHDHGARRIEAAACGARALALARLAAAAWHAGAARDAALALPLYLRDKVAQTTAERDAQRLAKAAS